MRCSNSKGCGAALEELPYLEILCVSDTAAEPRHGRPEEEGGCEEEEDQRGEREQGYEKQGSLITLAWSKQTQCDPEAVRGGSGECSVRVGMGDVDEAGEAHMEVLVEPPPAPSVIQVLHSAVERHRQYHTTWCTSGLADLLSSFIVFLRKGNPSGVVF